MPLTPEEFNKLATKEDLKKLEEKFDNLSSDVKLLLNSVDGLARKVDNLSSELVANQAAHDRFETRITDLEKAAL